MLQQCNKIDRMPETEVRLGQAEVVQHVDETLRYRKSG
jgi:hypothetical protein